MTEPRLELDPRISLWARRIVEKRLESPAIFFLESHLPVVTLVQNLGIFFEPLLTPFFGSERIASLKELLSSRDSVEQLISEIERYSVAKSKGDKL